MIRVSLKGMAGRKLRAALTAISIVLGVAMISGTYVLTDTINNGFDSIFQASYKNADVIVSGKSAVGDVNGEQTEAPSIPASLLAKIKRLPDVADAAGTVQSGDVRFVDRNGKVITTGGLGSFGMSVDPKSDPRFNPVSLAAGAWPQGPGQVAVDKNTAADHGFAVGDSIGLEVNGPQQQFTIAGIVKFGGADSIGSATIAVFDQTIAQQLFQKEGQLDLIRVQSKAGVSTGEMLRQIRPILPTTAIARDAAAQAQKDKKNVDGALKIIKYALLAFAGIALFVGGFVIANTLSITIAQRVREFATLRTIGASRRQVLRSVILEALVVGVIGSVAGLFLGLGLAKGLNALFVMFGIDLPTGSTVLAARTIVVSLVVGILITLIASLRPALRATRVPPIAAVREGSVLPPSRFARFGPATALVVLVLGTAMLVYGTLGDASTKPRLALLGFGVLLLFIGVSLNAPRLVPLFASALGWPAAQTGGVAGRLARDNAIRNPSRTASTASALMIGLALVTFVALFGAGLRSSFESAVDDLFVADYAITASDTFSPLTVEAEQAAKTAPGVRAVAGIRAGSAKYLGSSTDLSAVDTNVGTGLHLEWAKGSDRIYSQLGDDGMFTDADYAKDHHLRIGSPVKVTFASGRSVVLRLKATYEMPKGGSPLADMTVSSELFDKYVPRPQNTMTLVNMKGGVNDGNTALLELPLKQFADAKVQTQSEFKKNFEKPINKLLYILYSLLGLSVIVSLFGIVNTLVLTVFERTREIGMLRAVGMTRRQVRRMIRHESIVTALLGAVFGIVIGILLAVLITHALSDEGVVFAVPYLQLVYFVIAAVVVGILAAILPARRAARLNVLQALQYE
jgi:putative ABC transport system permease protein